MSERKKRELGCNYLTYMARGWEARKKKWGWMIYKEGKGSERVRELGRNCLGLLGETRHALTA